MQCTKDNLSIPDTSVHHILSYRIRRTSTAQRAVVFTCSSTPKRHECVFPIPERITFTTQQLLLDVHAVATARSAYTPGCMHHSRRDGIFQSSTLGITQIRRPSSIAHDEVSPVGCALQGRVAGRYSIIVPRPLRQAPHLKLITLQQRLVKYVLLRAKK